MVDPQVVADLEKEEEELMARLEDVREKLRRIKAPIVIRRPAIPTLFKVIRILRWRHFIPLYFGITTQVYYFNLAPGR